MTKLPKKQITPNRLGKIVKNYGFSGDGWRLVAPGKSLKIHTISTLFKTRRNAIFCSMITNPFLSDNQYYKYRNSPIIRACHT